MQEQQNNKEKTKHENKQKQEKLDQDKKQVDDPKMNPEQKNEAPAPEQHDDGEAMEYEFDEAAEQMQGKLAADNAEELPDVNPDDKTGQQPYEEQQDQDIDDQQE